MHGDGIKGMQTRASTVIESGDHLPISARQVALQVNVKIASLERRAIDARRTAKRQQHCRQADRGGSEDIAPGPKDSESQARPDGTATRLHASQYRLR
jgi:hypothetical protein